MQCKEGQEGGLAMQAYIVDGEVQVARLRDCCNVPDCVLGGDVAVVLCDLRAEHAAVSGAEPVHAYDTSAYAS